MSVTKAKILHRQLELTYKQSAVSAIVWFAILTILAYFLHSYGQKGVINWYILVVANFIFRYYTVFEFKKNRSDIGKLNYLYNIYIVSVAFSGLINSALSIFFWPPDFAHQAIMLICIAGMSAGATVIYAIRKEFFYIYYFPTIAPMTWYYLTHINQENIATAVMVVFFTFIMIVTVNRVYAVYFKSINLAFEKEELVEEISEANSDLKTKSAEIDAQKNLLLNRNERLTDSLDYAEIIQKALVAGEEYFKSVYPKGSYWVKPKDIVSGDFLWMKRNGEQTFFALVDCTGHGVPGAFMSLATNALLDKAFLKDNSSSKKLLEALAYEINELAIERNTSMKDGFDIGMVGIDFSKKEISFTGTHIPMYLIRKNNVIEVPSATKYETNNICLFEIKADKTSLRELTINTNLNETIIKYLPGDRIYLFSDGFSDQKGGAEGKKFFIKNLRELLIQIQSIPIDQQKEKLEKSLINWMGNYEQVDDISFVFTEL